MSFSHKKVGKRNSMSKSHKNEIINQKHTKTPLILWKCLVNFHIKIDNIRNPNLFEKNLILNIFTKIHVKKDFPYSHKN